MANFKGGFAFNNEAAKVEVEQAPDGTLISCVNPVTGESLGGGDSSLFVEPVAGSSFIGNTQTFVVNGNFAQLVLPVVAGDTVQFSTINHYKVSSIKTKDSGVAVAYTTTSETSYGATYNFTMPDEGVLVTIYYND